MYKGIATIVIVAVGASLIVWARDGQMWHIAKSIPGFSGDSPGWVYSAGGIAMLLITVWGLRRLFNKQ